MKKSKAYKDFKEKLLNFHRSESPSGQFGGTQLFDYKSTVSTLIYEYAKSYPDFTSLSTRLASALMTDKPDLFFGYVLSKYLYETNARYQLSWMLVSEEFRVKRSDLRSVGCLEFLQAIGFPLEAETLDETLYLVNNINKVNISIGKLHLLLLAILFHGTEDSKKSIMYYGLHEEESLRLLEKIGIERTVFSRLMTDLKSLSDKIKSKIRQEEMLTKSMELVNPYNRYAADFTRNEIDQMHAKFLSLSFGEEIIGCLYKYLASGIEVKPDILSSVMACYGERFHRVFSSCEEFQMLKKDEKVNVWLSSIVPAVCTINAFHNVNPGVEDVAVIFDQQELEVLASAKDECKEGEVRPFFRIGNSPGFFADKEEFDKYGNALAKSDPLLLGLTLTAFKTLLFAMLFRPAEDLFPGK